MKPWNKYWISRSFPKFPRGNADAWYLSNIFVSQNIYLKHGQRHSKVDPSGDHKLPPTVLNVLVKETRGYPSKWSTFIAFWSLHFPYRSLLPAFRLSVPLRSQPSFASYSPLRNALFRCKLTQFKNSFPAIITLLRATFSLTCWSVSGDLNDFLLLYTEE